VIGGWHFILLVSAYVHILAQVYFFAFPLTAPLAGFLAFGAALIYKKNNT